MYQKRLLIVICCLFLGIKGFSQVVNLTQVIPDYFTNDILLQWMPISPAFGPAEYRYSVSSDGGVTYGPWISAALSTSITYTFLAPGVNNISTYSFKVQWRNAAGVWSASSNIRSTKFSRGWPVENVACNNEQIGVLNNFMQPIDGSATGSPPYFHEGLDINGAPAIDSECVVAPFSGEIIAAFGAVGNMSVRVRFVENGVNKYYHLGHLQNTVAGITTNTSITAGNQIGTITTRWTTPPISTLGLGFGTIANHTHFHYWTDNTNINGSTKNPLRVFKILDYKDPQGNDVSFFDSNTDLDTIRFKTGPHNPGMASYLPVNSNYIYGPIDIIVEVNDDKSMVGGSLQIPEMLGYYIKFNNNELWEDAVKSIDSTYMLFNLDTLFGNFNAGVTANDRTMVDFDLTLQSAVPANTPTGYTWPQWFTFQLTNCKDTVGIMADIDPMQCWATDATDGQAMQGDNGYVAGYTEAKYNGETKFSDGEYKIFVRTGDYRSLIAPDSSFIIAVDNYSPFIQKVEVFQGSDLIYKREWTWNGADKMVLQAVMDCVKGHPAKGVSIKVTTSEPMETLDLTTAPVISNTMKREKDNVYIFTLNASEVREKAIDQTVTLTFKGKDYGGNDLIDIDGSFANFKVPKRTNHTGAAQWADSKPLDDDTLHYFQIGNSKDCETNATINCN